jgi:hypothetical protein
MPPVAAHVLLALALVAIETTGIAAQDEPPPIGPFVLDVRGTFPPFPEDLQLADSRGLNTRELPGRGLGVDVGAHVYLFRWKAITFGLGGQFTVGRARFVPPPERAESFRSVTERFTSFSPQLSFNFGNGNGWSYFSGGVGGVIWSILPDGAATGPADEETLRAFNYGGGARWFIKPHLAFTFDVRFHAIDPGTPYLGRPGSPRTLLLVMGAGLSIK